ncbi:MAG TPA: DUF1449 domain-containing protein [Crenotrichaceae bacterium]|nr:DUF1449 domain-containing protein [Crenotrichaceae bacterium]
MDPFYQNISSFPTAVFTFVLAICVLYWLLAVLGVADIDILDIDGLDVDGTDMDLGTGSEATTANALAGLMLKFGLNGVPVTIIISFLSLFGWLISYYCVHFLSTLIPQGIIRFVFDVVILIGAFWVAVFITALIIKLIRPLFHKMEQQTIKRVLGQSAVVRTSKVTDSFGEATLNDGGAGLILKVRAGNGQTFKRGNKVVLLEYLEAENAYRVISEAEFNA